MCTYDCVPTQDNTIIIKYVDDTTILGLIKGEDKLENRNVDNIFTYGDKNNVILNTDKTKNILDFWKNTSPLRPLIIKGTEVDRVDSHRFLGLQGTSDLSRDF